MKKTIVGFILLGLCIPIYLFAGTKKDNREYYKIIIYHFKNAEQKQELDNYLENAYLPALHRLGIKNVGVFTPIANDTATDKRIFIIIPAKSLQVFHRHAGKTYKGCDLPGSCKKIYGCSL